MTDSLPQVGRPWTTGFRCRLSKVIFVQQTMCVLYQVAVEIDRGRAPGAVTRCHLVIPDAAAAVCGYTRASLYVAEWTWADVSQLYRCHRCAAVAPEA
jgi:hypothetical protein